MAQDNTSNANYYLQKLEKKSRNPIDPLDAGSLIAQSGASSNTVATSDVLIVAYINDASDQGDYQDFDNKPHGTNFDVASITSGQTLSIVSDNAADAAAGTGIQSFLVTGLDDNFDPISETITLAGLTPATSTKLFLRVNSVLIASVGSTGAAVGDITCTGGGTTWWKCIATESAVPLHIYTVPRGHTATFKYVFWSSSNKGEATVRQISNFNNLPHQTLTKYILNGNAGLAIAHLPYKITETADLFFQIRREASSGVMPMQLLVVGSVYNNQSAIRYFDG